MIAINDKLVSHELIEKHFICNLNACKGNCCVLGDEGAPLAESEIKILEDIYPKVEPYLNEKGKKAIAEQGTHAKNEGNEPVTPLVNNKECAYVFFDEKNIAMCGIETAYNEGKIDFKKPVSCHLYPIRITKYDQYEAVNYEKWEICSPACELGKEMQVPLYRFLKEPLVRKYGQAFYDELDAVAKHLDE